MRTKKTQNDKLLLCLAEISNLCESGFKLNKKEILEIIEQATGMDSQQLNKECLINSQKRCAYRG